MRYLMLAAAMLSIAGCATSASKPMPPELAGGTVAVLSTIPEDAFLYSLGFTAFGNQSAKFENDWNMRKHVEVFAVSQLEMNDRFTAFVVPESGVRENFISVGIDAKHTAVWDISKRKQKVIELAAELEPKPDLVLLIASRPVRDTIYDTSWLLAGYGVHQYGAAEDSKSTNYAVAQLVLYDATTGEEITFNEELASSHRDPGQYIKGETLTLRDGDAARTRKSIENLYEELIVQTMKAKGITLDVNASSD